MFGRHFFWFSSLSGPALTGYPGPGLPTGGIDTALSVLSSPTPISVAADLDTQTYYVAVNGAVIETGIPFAANASLDTVRFLTTTLNEVNISGRTFDNVVIRRYPTPTANDSATASPTKNLTLAIDAESSEITGR